MLCTVAVLLSYGNLHGSLITPRPAAEVLMRHADPLAELLAGAVPAFIVRGAYSAAAAAALVRRFFDRGPPQGSVALSGRPTAHPL